MSCCTGVCVLLHRSVPPVALVPMSCYMHVYVLLHVCVCPVVLMCMSIFTVAYVLIHRRIYTVAFVRMSCCTDAFVLLYPYVCPVQQVRMSCCIDLYVLLHVQVTPHRYLPFVRGISHNIAIKMVRNMGYFPVTIVDGKGAPYNNYVKVLYLYYVCYCYAEGLSRSSMEARQVLLYLFFATVEINGTETDIVKILHKCLSSGTYRLVCATVCMSCCMHARTCTVVSTQMYCFKDGCTCLVAHFIMSCCMFAHVLLHVCTCPVARMRVSYYIIAHVLFC